jgi:hypothetical protein
MEGLRRLNYRKCVNNNSRTSSTTFKRENKKSIIPKLINFDYLRGTVQDGRRVAGRDRHEVAPADGMTPSERRGQCPAASASRCSCPPLAVELPLQPTWSPPSLVLTALFTGGPSTSGWKDPRERRGRRPAPLGSRGSCPTLAVELPLHPARSPPFLTLAAPFARGPCAGR